MSFNQEEIQEILSIYKAESEEHLQKLNQCLLQLRFGDQLLFEQQVTEPDASASLRILSHTRCTLFGREIHVRDSGGGRLNDARPVGIVVDDDRSQENDQLRLGLDFA